MAFLDTNKEETNPRKILSNVLDEIEKLFS